jgi:hypothetical protein
LKAQTASPKSKRHEEPLSEIKGTQVTRKRREEGHQGESDIQEEKLTPEVRKKEIREELIERGSTEQQADELAAQTVGRGLKYTFVQSNINGPAFFDVKSRGGAVIISLNVSHPAYVHLVELLREDADELEEDELRLRLTMAREGLELLLMAWARYEDEQPDGKRRTQVQDARWDWGRMAREFLMDEDDD